MDGNSLSKNRLSELRSKVDAEFKKIGKRPGLAVVRVGDFAPSKIYVGKKIKACEAAGIHSVERHLPETATQSQVSELIHQLNEDKNIHGILLQLPLPKQLSENKLLEIISPQKDVDGLHPLNLGRLAARLPGFVPCTPLGIMSLLTDYKITIAGKKAVVIGRSRIVGRPISLLLDQAGATVTVVHSQTPNMDEFLEDADIIVVAVGKPHFLSKQKVKKGVAIIDVGINRLESGKIVGDVDFESIKDQTSAITPVPGGVGPMTICSLLENTWTSFLHENSPRK